jgi:hypothetical protein
MGIGNLAPKLPHTWQSLDGTVNDLWVSAAAVEDSPHPRRSIGHFRAAAQLHR